MITIAMQLGLAPHPVAKPAKARRNLMDGSKAEAKVDRTLSATQAMHARRSEIVAMLGTAGPMFRGEIQEGLTMPATPDQLKRDMTELVKAGVIRARECDGTHRIYWRPAQLTNTPIADAVTGTRSISPLLNPPVADSCCGALFAEQRNERTRSL